MRYNEPMRSVDINDIKKDFPLFQKHPRLVYLDSTATSLKPRIVIAKESEYYNEYSANVFRGIYQISEQATSEYEETRTIVSRFINAKSAKEIVFTRNTTESLNLIAYGLGRKIISAGNEIVVSVMEHHSNFVPWQVLASESNADFKVIGVTPTGFLDIYDKKGKLSLNGIITSRTKLLCLTHVSNVTGVINPIREIIAAAKKINPTIITIIDGAQSVPHMQVDVQYLGCDFLAFSSHKMLGPTGVGVLYGKYELLDDMYPFLYGGEMIDEVFIEKTLYKEPPHKFEAGTPDIAGVSALKEAVAYLTRIGMSSVREHEREITKYAIQSLMGEFGDQIQILGPADAERKGGILAFTFGKIHTHDVAYILDEENIAVRAGNHCAMPLHTFLKKPATTRASFYIYTNTSDVDALVVGLKKVKKMLG